MAKINVDQMASEIEKMNKEWFNELNSKIQRDAIQETAKETVKTLKAISPKGERVGKSYAKTWTYNRSGIYNDAFRFATEVHNKENYRLTHLLEYGHAKTGKKGGRTKAQPHIATAEQQAEEMLIDKVLDIISKS